MRIFTALFVSLSASIAFAGDLDIRFVAELDKYDVYEGHVFHEGRLWVGWLRENENAKHKVVVFDRTGEKRLATIRVSHTVSYLYPFGKGQLVAVGKSSWPWKTHFTLISASDYSTKTFTFPEKYQVDQFAGRPGQMYFTEPGSRGVFRFRTKILNAFPFEVSGPRMMELAGEDLYVVEGKSFYFGDENLIRIDPRTNKAERTFPRDRNGLTYIKYLPGHDLIAASETAAGNVLFVSTRENKLVGSVAVPGSPREIAHVGNCLYVTSEDSKTVTIIGLWDRTRVLKTLDISPAGDRLKRPRRIAVDPETGRIFLRSTYMCPSCTVTQSSVVSVMEKDGSTFSRCR